MSKRTETTREALKAFRIERNQLAEQRRQMAAHPDYSQGFKDKEASRLRSQHEQALKVSARRLWQSVNEHQASAKTALGELHQAHSATWDYQKLDFLTRELTARLGSLERSSGPLGAGSVGQIAVLADSFRALADAHALRALRLAAAPLLAGIPVSAAPESITAASLKRQFAADEAATQPAGVVEAEAELRDLSRLVDEVRGDITAAEAEVTGRDDLLQAGVFGTPRDPWAHDVFDEPRPAPVPPRQSTNEGEKAPEPKAERTDAQIVADLTRQINGQGGIFGQNQMVEA